MTHIYVSKLTIIGLDDGLSPGRRRNIIWSTAGILLIGQNKPQYNIKWNSHTFIQEYASKHGEMAAILFRPQCVGLENLPYM